MMEYDDEEALTTLDVFSAMRGSGVPVELYIYPGDFHVFVSRSTYCDQWSAISTGSASGCRVTSGPIRRRRPSTSVGMQCVRP